MSSPTPGARLDQLRRATDDRIVAGVASGLARAFGIDPVIVRIAFVVLTLVGFAGPILYVAAWLLVPREGAERSALGDALGLASDAQLRTVGLAAAAVIAGLAFLGDASWGVGGWFWWPLWTLAWIAIPLGALYWAIFVRPRQATRQTFVPPPPYQPDAPAAATSADPTTSSTTGDTAMTEPVSQGEATAVLDGPTPPPPAAPPGTPYGAQPPRRPRERWSPALLLLTLSAIVTAMGALGLWSVTQDPLPAATYPAVALGIVVVGLLVGTRVGHPGALIPVGLLLVPVLAAASFLPSLDAGQVDIRPTTAAEVPTVIEQGAGEVRLDLTQVTDPQALAGRELEIRNGLGSTTVYLPEGLDVSVETSLKLGGRIQVFDRVADGRGAELEKDSTAPGAFDIEINGTAGEIVVMNR